MNKKYDEANIMKLMLALSRCKDSVQLFRALDSISVYDLHHIKIIAESVLNSKKSKFFADEV